VIENDRKVRGSSYRDHAEASAQDTFGGRYSTAVKVKTMPGRPSLWANDPKEPPLGYSVNDQEPTGEKFEQEASKASTSGEQPSHVAVQTDVGVGGDGHSSSEVLMPVVAREGKSSIPSASGIEGKVGGRSTSPRPVTHQFKRRI
jgi:hypothetical protein